MWFGIGTVVTISEGSQLARASVMMQLRFAHWAATLKRSDHLPIEPTFGIMEHKDLARIRWLVTFSRGERGTIERCLEFHELLQLVLLDEDWQSKAVGVAGVDCASEGGSAAGSESEAGSELEADFQPLDSEDLQSSALTTDESAKQTRFEALKGVQRSMRPVAKKGSLLSAVPQPEPSGACLDLKASKVDESQPGRLGRGCERASEQRPSAAEHPPGQRPQAFTRASGFGVLLHRALAWARATASRAAVPHPHRGKAFGGIVPGVDSGFFCGSESEAEFPPLESEDLQSPALTTGESPKRNRFEAPRPEPSGACLDLKSSKCIDAQPEAFGAAGGPEGGSGSESEAEFPHSDSEELHWQSPALTTFFWKA
jgi:hypothetical protein